MLVAIGLIVLVVMINVIEWRDVKIAEKFESVQAINLNDMRHEKNNAFYNEGMKAFFGGGPSDANKLFFRPSELDVACKLLLNQCDNRTPSYLKGIHAVTHRDTSTPIWPSILSYGDRNSSTRPFDLRDCQVRIMTGTYDFVKTCIKVQVTTHDGNSFSVVANSRATRFLMLARPVFVSGPMSKLYRLRLPTPYIGNTSMTGAGSTANPSITLEEVTSPLVWSSGGVQLSQSMSLIRNATSSALNNPEYYNVPLTIYYLKFIGNFRTAPLVGSSASRTWNYNVLTLYVNMSGPDSQRPATSIVSGITVAAGGAVTYNNITIPTSITRGYMVVTITSSIVIIARFTPDSSRIETASGSTVSIPSGTIINDAYRPSSHLLPYDNFCVPNYADLASKLGML